MTSPAVGALVKTKAGNGQVSFVGETQFAAGSWVGVTLDEPNGKNDGSVQGVRYFTAKPNHGMFVRPAHITIIPARTSNKVSTRQSLAKTRQSLAQPAARRTSMRPPSQPQTPTEKPPTKPPSPIEKEPSEPKEAPKQPEVIHIETGVSLSEVQALKSQIKDWKSRCDILQIKRREESEKVKNAEKIRLQLEQSKTERERLQASVKELTIKLDTQTAAYKQLEEDTADVQETIENAILDKDTADARCEELEVELDDWKTKYEEIECDYELLKAEVEEHGVSGAGETFANKSLAEESAKLREALVEMKGMFATEKSERSKLQKEMDALQNKLTKANQKLNQVNSELEQQKHKTIELLEQVDALEGVNELVGGGIYCLNF